MQIVKRVLTGLSGDGHANVGDDAFALDQGDRRTPLLSESQAYETYELCMPITEEDALDGGEGEDDEEDEGEDGQEDLASAQKGLLNTSSIATGANAKIS